MFGISASLGSQKSSSEQHQEQTHVTGSTLTAGNNLTINATGEGNAANSGDIVVQGSQLQAGGDTTLDAARDVLLLGAANTQKTDGSNSSSGGSVGVSLGVSGASSGLSIFANANKGQGSEHGDGISWTETTLDSGGTLSLYSGRDTSLVGAQVSGETVKVEVGRDLLLQSQQDSDNYDAKQQSSSVGGSFSPGSMTGSISINGSQDKLNSNFDSVQEQTGIFAGSGGFDITVGGHTQLDGAVIGSTATADKNTLDTGTLGFSDIDNQADFKVEHQSVGISTGGNIGSQFVGNMANGLLVGANNEGHADSTTHAAVSEGTITVRDTDNQQQNVDDLSRDVEQANNALSPIFDKEKEQNRLKEAQLIGEIGSQVGDVFRTQGQIIATQAATEKMQGVSEADREAAKANWEKANPGQIATAEDINGQVYKTAYDQAFNASGYGTGGKFQQAVQAATAALQGLAGGDIAKAIAGGSAPYLAEVIKQSTGDNEEARLAAHAVVGSVLAHLQGNSAVAGGAGALTGEIAADLIMQQLYPGKMVSELSETEKQTISALSTLAAGLAGGLTGDSSADAVAGAQAGKNAVENNALGLALKGCGIAAPCRSLIAKQVLEIGVKAGITGIVAKEIADKISEDDLDHLVTLKMMGNDEITEKYLNSLQDKYAPAHTGGDQNAGSGPTDTGGNQIADNSPDHTGNDQSTGQGATNTGNTDGKPDAGGSSTVTPIPEGANKDDLAYLALKGKEAQEAAKNLGFDRRISPQKAPFNSHGQPVYFDGKNYITPDIDSHNVTNGWKMFDRKGDRIGTYDSNLNRIKD
ncbi:hemagglutinin repeat-containing protein [Yersinia pseudotuberculosis]|uniref:hemagglutinin repeat-containing protein n=2 Tax=Yersinia pseudotuberculosis TaxID=633 RepID=UPI0038B58B19